jgi:hypothetical protein
MSIRATLLAVIVLGCCLISIVSAAGWGGCSPQGPPHYSYDPYWGMSADEILNARSSADVSGESVIYVPEIVIPSYSSGKFASLPEFKSKLGDSQSISILKPDSSNFYVKPDFNVKSNLINKQLFF